MNFKMILGFFCLTLLIFNSSFLEAKEEPGAANKKSAMANLKSVKGQVGILRSKYIEIEYAQDKDGAYSMVFPIPKDIEIQNKKSIDEIQQGDTVELIYEERTWLTEDGEEKSEAVPKKIRFVSAAPPQKQLISEETE